MGVMTKIVTGERVDRTSGNPVIGTSEKQDLTTDGHG
jgi:hypothetical protein